MFKKIISLMMSLDLIVGALQAYTITIKNDSDCLILVEAHSATYNGFSELVDSGDVRTVDFGDSCPWWIKVSNFTTPLDGRAPQPVELHYGDNISEQCTDKKLVITANNDDWTKVTSISVHTEPWAHDGTRAQHGWKNDWSSTVATKNPNPKFKSKL